jgi:hypothetical protein
LEATIIEIVPNQYIKVHFKGWASKFDEYIPISADANSGIANSLLEQKYAEVGMYSNGYGQAKFDPSKLKLNYHT